MTRTRVIAALVMAPVAIAAILLLPTPWLAALSAVVFLVGAAAFEVLRRRFLRLWSAVQVEIEQRINHQRDALRRAHLKSVESGDHNIKSGLVYNDLFSSCEKLGDHLINVSEALTGMV